MSDKINRITLIISAVLMVLAIAVGVYFYYVVMTMETMPDSIVLPAEKLAWNMERLGGSLELFSLLTYLFVGLSIFVTFGFSVANLFKSKATAMNSLKSLGMLLGVFIFAYILASPQIPVFLGYEKFNLTPGVVKAVDTGLIATYLFFAIAVFGIVFTGVRSMLRR